MKGALDAIAGLVTGGKSDAKGLAWHALRYEHTQAIRAFLAKSYAPATANKMLAALKGVLKQAWTLELMDSESYQRAINLPTVKGSRLPKGRALSHEEIRAVFKACAKAGSLSGIRDAAILAVLYGAGLRREEIVNLDLSDYVPQSGALTIQRGKGNKARMVFATNGAHDALEDWLEVRGNEPGPLFIPVLKGERLVIRRLSTQAIYNLLRKRAEEAGVAPFSPHDLRRSMISDLLDAKVDLATVQQMAGHANVNTTARYDRRGEEAKRQAAKMLKIPYRKPKSH